jgi:G3E family GTPase
MKRIPVTIVTGFLGAGKTTLLNHILRQPHGLRLAVIENEFGAEGIDNELLLSGGGEQIVEMNNGCICCTVRGDLVRILSDLHERRDAFDRVVIETTGLADPAPVAQTFFIDEEIRQRYRLDGVLTVVDALHGGAALDQHPEAQEQVGFADRVLLSKLDLVTDGADVHRLQSRLARLNARAPVLPMDFGRVPLDQVLDIDGFALDDILAIEPDFLIDVTHEHDDAIGSRVVRSDRPYDGAKLQAFFRGLLAQHGPDLLRYKGIVALDGLDSRLVLQGVHMLMSSDAGRAWSANESRTSKLVFIGRDLAVMDLETGLAACTS